MTMNSKLSFPKHGRARPIRGFLFFIAIVLGATALLPRESVAATSTFNTYDTVNRMSNVTYSDGRQVTYTYDGMGNITSIVTKGASSPVSLAVQPASVAVTTGQMSVGIAAAAAAPVGSAVYLSNNIPAVSNSSNPDGRAFAAVFPSNVQGGSAGGFLSVVVNPWGFFTGKLGLGGCTYSIHGRFDGTTGSSGTIVIPRAAPSGSLTLNLVLTLTADGGGEVTGVLSDGEASATLAGGIASWGKANPTTPPSASGGSVYNMTLLTGTDSDNFAGYPQGTGFATVRVLPTGSVRMNGWLADGTPFTANSILDPCGDIPLFALPYGTGGGLAGILHVDLGDAPGSWANNLLTGTLTWTRPPAATTLYRAGFTINIFAVGTRQAPPAKGSDEPVPAGR